MESRSILITVILLLLLLLLLSSCVVTDNHFSHIITHRTPPSMVVVIIWYVKRNSSKSDEKRKKEVVRQDKVCCNMSGHDGMTGLFNKSSHFCFSVVAVELDLDSFFCCLRTPSGELIWTGVYVQCTIHVATVILCYLLTP